MLIEPGGEIVARPPRGPAGNGAMSQSNCAFARRSSSCHVPWLYAAARPWSNAPQPVCPPRCASVSAATPYRDTRSASNCSPSTAFGSSSKHFVTPASKISPPLAHTKFCQ
jgi:hypothetical protein